LSDEASGRKVDTELANRLDSLFEEDDDQPAGNAGEGADPLEELNSLVMSIEWEITDDLMGRFVAQVEALKQRYRDDRILVMFLQLLGSLGLYVKSNKGNAHPTAFSLLNTVYTSFASAAVPGKISSSEKKKLLYVELNKYKELKEQIGLARDPSKEHTLKKAPTRDDAASGRNHANDHPQGDAMLFDENPADQTPAVPVTVPQFEAAIDSIRQLIREEFQKLRDALGQNNDS
jgi:pilus assembly protein FimV